MDDFEISFKVKAPEDVTPPVRRGLNPTGVLAAGTTTTTISVWTNEPAYCRYSTEPETLYKSMRKRFYQNEKKTYHYLKIKDLEDGKTYDLFVRCKDLEGNANTGDVMIRFSVGL
jgi:lipoate-protein ligase A